MPGSLMPSCESFEYKGVVFMLKRWLSILLAALLVLSFTPASLAEGNGYGPGETNEWGWVMPQETIEFSFFFTNTGKNPNKYTDDVQPLLDYIYDNFNVKINCRVADSKPQETLNLLLAAGDYPDVIAGLDQVAYGKWKEQERLVELTPYMDQVGENIKASLGDDYTRYLDEDGKLFYLPNGYGGDMYPWFCATVRLDQYEEMGSPEIQTMEDYYEYLKALVEKHPENERGEKTYALSWNDNNRLDVIAGFWGIKDGYKESEDHRLTHWINTDEGLQMTLYFNRFYREGLMDPDAFINKYDDWKMKFSNERIFGHIGQWFEVEESGYQIWQKTNENWTDEMRFVPVDIKADGVDQACLAPKDTLGWVERTVITDKCANPSEVLRFIDFTTSPMGIRLVSWGVPNTPDSAWNYEGGDQWSFNETFKASVENGTFDYPKYLTLGGESLWFSVDMRPFRDDPGSMCWINQCFPDRWKKLWFDVLDDTLFDNTARRIAFEPDNPLTVAKQRVDDAIDTGWVKAVMCKSEEECEKVFMELREKVNGLGLHDIEQYRTDELIKNLTAWGQI